MRKLVLVSTLIISIICCSQYISADDEYYRIENNGIGQGGNGNGNGGAGQGNGNGNATPTNTPIDAPIDDYLGLIGFAIVCSIILIQIRKKQK